VREPAESIGLLLDFMNTVDVEEGTDLFAAGAKPLSGWLSGHGLARPGTRATPTDVQAALDLRRGLRSLALANNDEPTDPDDVRAAQDVLSSFSFRLVLPMGAERTPVLSTRGRSVSDALGTIAAAYFTAAVRGDWPRVRRCPAPDCAWVFWDSSKNASRRWCSMRVCGNRAKARAFRLR
jgi:predicted RNA-binding Zn ribbon-like protein